MLVDVYRCPGQGTVDLFKVLRDRLPTDGSRQTLDYLVVTHAHDDHIWGIGDLADEFEIGELWVPQYGTKKKLSENYDAFVKVVENQPDDRKVWQKGSRSPAKLADALRPSAVSLRPATWRWRRSSMRRRRGVWSTRTAGSTGSATAG
jgi:glyoxylase-like metal-dependent hydrolase (beta-lactamase superfamily II)